MAEALPEFRATPSWRCIPNQDNAWQCIGPVAQSCLASVNLCSMSSPAGQQACRCSRACFWRPCRGVAASPRRCHVLRTGWSPLPCDSSRPHILGVEGCALSRHQDPCCPCYRPCYCAALQPALVPINAPWVPEGLDAGAAAEPDQYVPELPSHRQPGRRSLCCRGMPPARRCCCCWACAGGACPPP